VAFLESSGDKPEYYRQEDDAHNEYPDPAAIILFHFVSPF
jgi:hypothetical protein